MPALTRTSITTSARNAPGPQPVQAKKAAPQRDLADLLDERLNISEPAAPKKRKLDETLPATTKTAVDGGRNGGRKEREEGEKKKGGDGGGDKDTEEEEEEEEEHPPWCNCSGIGTPDDVLLRRWER